MVVVLFRSVSRDTAGADYAAMAADMLARARTMPGFVDFASFTSEAGEHLSVIHFESQEALRAWSDDARHMVAQQLGRDQWYESFHVEVAEVVRSYEFRRPAQ